MQKEEHILIGAEGDRFLIEGIPQSEMPSQEEFCKAIDHAVREVRRRCGGSGGSEEVREA